MFISVALGNFGTFGEIFDVVVDANGTSILTQTVALASGNCTTLIFTWNTTTFNKGNYIISGFSQPVSGETDVSDNSFESNRTVKVTLSGDVNGDFGVGPADFAMLSVAYGSTPAKPSWIPNADIDNNEKVGPSDFAVLSSRYGQHWP